MRRVLTAVICAILLLAVLPARADDFGSWHFIQATKSLGSSGFYLGARAEYRDCNHFSATERWFLRPIVGYRIAPWLKGEVMYDFMRKPGDVQIHQALAGLTATLRQGPLAVSLRERYQYSWNATAGTARHYLRSYLKTAYAIPDSRLTPYLAVELFTWSDWVKTRHYAGCSLRLSAQCALEVSYLYHTFASQEASHILGLGCNLTL